MSNQKPADVIKKSIEQISNNQKTANVTFKADTNLVEGLKCSAKIRNLPEIIIDEQTNFGGSNAGVNPVELLLASLGTCQEIMYATYASLLDIKLNSVNVKLKGDIDLRGMLAIDEKVPSGFKNINFETHIESDANEEVLVDLIDAVEEHCPVMDTLLREIAISGSAAINGKEVFRSVAKKPRI